MFNKIKRILIGPPLKNEAIQGEKYGVLWGLPILASDAISSVAYAIEEILLALIPVLAFASYHYMLLICGMILSLLVILVFSYSQTIEKYPNGGGAFVVASDNLGRTAGVTAGAALAVDYILTVAVSVSSGVEQLTSAFTVLKPYTVPICVGLVLLLMLGNLRGLRESSRIFGMPTYAFILGIIIMIFAGFIKIKSGYVPDAPSIKATGTVSMFLILRAFSNGCSALTGVEAVSNAVPNFKEPSVKNAKRVLFLLGIFVLITFSGVATLVSMYHIVPGNSAVIIQLAEKIFGRNFAFYYVTVTTFIILIIASNTAYAGFPLLMSVMAKSEYVPRRLGMRGDRLSYSNGIVTLSVVAIALIVIFKARVKSLIGLYAIGVFISFTLSQTGMFKKWHKEKGKSWKAKAAINGIGAIATLAVVVIISFTKFSEGAWAVIIVLPIAVWLMLQIKKHYEAVADQLRINEEDIGTDEIRGNYNNIRVIVPIESVNRSSVQALRYAQSISKNVVAFNVSIDEEGAAKVKKKYDMLNISIPLVVQYSPYRQIVEPLLKFIDSEEYNYKKGEIITVILPQFIVTKSWHQILHNRTRVFVEKQLLKYKHIVVATMPYQLTR